MNLTPKQQHNLLSKMGYTGPVDSKLMNNFLSSNPGAAAKMGKFDRAMKRGFQTGGLVPGGVSSSSLMPEKTAYSESMGNLAQVEKEAAGWSIGATETKEVEDSSSSGSSSGSIGDNRKPGPASWYVK